MAENKRRDPSTRSPFAGCTIILVGIVAMVFLVAFVIWNLFKLDREISKFTTSEAEPTPVVDLVDRMEAYNDFQSRLQLFKDADGTGQDAELRLSAEDINLAIAAYNEFEELRGTFSVTEIREDEMLVAISFPLRGKPMSDEMRYLNGTMRVFPKLSGDEVILEVSEVIVPDAVVPDGFIGQLSPYRVTQRYLEDPVIGPWMKRLTNLSIADRSLVLTINAEEAAKEELPEDVSPYINRFLLATGVSALVFVGIVVMIALFAKKRARRRQPSEPLDPGQL